MPQVVQYWCLLFFNFVKLLFLSAVTVLSVGALQKQEIVGRLRNQQASWPLYDVHAELQHVILVLRSINN
jgi:hypothetical protein